MSENSAFAKLDEDFYLEKSFFKIVQKLVLLILATIALTETSEKMNFSRIMNMN